MDDLYGHACPECGGLYNAVDYPVTFDPEALTKGLREIYDGLDVKNVIERFIFEETLRLFNEAAAKGMADSEYAAVASDEFIRQIRTNNAVFSAFRVHRMQNDVARQLIDGDGKLKSFERWMQDIKGITNHYVRNWLQSEYSTAIIRAHQAVDWKHFETEQDVLPNLRWMPTTSPNQDPLHRQYWEKKLTLPVGHPFWDEHHPGDRWNCKCTLMQTDEPANDELVRDLYPVPAQPGLENNPAKDGKIFSDTHPYITQAYPGAEKAVNSKLDIPFDRNFKTVDESFDFIREYIAEDVTLTVKKSQLKNLTPILNQLANRMREFNIPKFKNIGNPASKNAFASWDESSNSLNIGQKLLNNPSSIWKAEMSWRKKGIRYSSIADEDDVVRNVVDHELGHKLMYQYNMKSDAIKVNTIAGKTVNGFNEINDVLGYYAGTDVDEFFAESFACYFGPNRNKMVETKKMIERLIAKARPGAGKALKTAVKEQRIDSDYILNGYKQIKVLNGKNPKLTEKVIQTENELRKNKGHETAVVFNKDGDVLVDKRGKATSVAFTESEVRKMKDAILTHNHPRGWGYDKNEWGRIGNSFGISDLKLAISADVAEIRAVTPNYTFSMLRPEKGWGISLDDFNRKYKEINDKLYNDNTVAVNLGLVTSEQATITHCHILNRSLAKEFGWIYTKRRTI